MCTFANYVIRKNAILFLVCYTLESPKRLVQSVFKFVKNVLYEKLLLPVSEMVKICEYVCKRV